MTNQDIINYVMETPCNSNPAVLNSLLNQLSSGVEIFETSMSLLEENGVRNYPQGRIILDKNYAEIKTAYTAGKLIFATYDIEYNGLPYTVKIPLQFVENVGDIDEGFMGLGYLGIMPGVVDPSTEFSVVAIIQIYLTDGEEGNASMYTGSNSI